ncbi:MAG: hypothetical protein LBH29_01625, partial [Elusimicrobiota bacterium]|nr:hypothetical protein [Elusimicrobiota bacterium]
MAKTDTENLPSKAAVLEAAQNQLLAVAKFTVKFNADFAVKDDAQAQAVGADLKVIKSALNSIEDERKKFTKPLDELKKFFMDGFRPAENALKTAEVIAKRALLEYQQELARA